MPVRLSSRNLRRLKDLLDTHGADPSRWPVDDAGELASLAQQNPAARRLLAEANAFDRVLATAQAGRSDQFSGLIDRISARAVAIRPAAAGTAEIVTLPVRPVSLQGHAVPQRQRRALWPVFGALAASLIVGFYVGTSSAVSPTLRQVAGIQADEDDSLTQASLTGVEEIQESELL